MRKGRRSNQRVLSWFVSCLTCLLLCFSILGCGPRKIANVDSKGRDIVCFGDSITAGYGVEPEQSYPSALAKMVDFPVINAGASGENSKEGLGRIEKDVFKHEPFLVIIEFSGNDFLDKVPMDETIKNIEKMILKSQEKGAMVALVDISAGLFMRAYRIELKKLSARRHSIFVPAVLDKVITNPQRKSDFLHPNAEGYRLVAERIFKRIQPYLERK